MPNEVKTQLRIPGEMHEEIKRLADQDFRSLNAEILALLQEAIERRHAAKAKKPEVTHDG